MSDDEEYAEGYKSGYAKGFGDGSAAGYSDAKYRAYCAVDAVIEGKEHSKPAVGDVEEAISRLVGKRT